MRIVVVGSMQFAEKQIETRDRLNALGHNAHLIDRFVKPCAGKTDGEKERIKLHNKKEKGAIRDYWRLMQGGDAILVVNLDKKGVKNYIGGNTLMEMGFAHVLDQKIFLLNPIPDIPYYKTEIEAMRPVILNGDLSKVC
jgi:hypothetical protein